MNLICFNTMKTVAAMKSLNYSCFQIEKTDFWGLRDVPEIEVAARFSKPGARRITYNNQDSYMNIRFICKQMQS